MGRLLDKRLWAVVVLAFVAAVVFYSPNFVLTTVVVHDVDRVVEGTVFRGSVAGALHQLGVALYEGDDLHPAETESPGALAVAVERATVAGVYVDGEYNVYSRPAETVGQFLQEVGVQLGPLDKVSPDVTTPMEPGLIIRVVRVRQEERERTAPVAYDTLLWAEPKWVEGETGQLRAGKEGVERQRMLLTYEDDQLVNTFVSERTVIEQPVAEIIGVGTRILVHSMETPAGVIRYTDVLKMEATAYYPGPESTGIWADGITSTGLRAGHGIIAVDPRVIPLGTEVYVPGYGIAVAGDIGGAIKGDIIDLAFDTYREAIHYGRRPVDVYILADAAQ